MPPLDQNNFNPNGMPYTPQPVYTPALKKKLPILVILGLILVVLGVLVFVFKDTLFKPNTDAEKQQIEQLGGGTEMERFILPTTGEVWHSEPKAMTTQGWILDEADMVDPVYQEVGMRGDIPIVLACVYQDDTVTCHLFERRKEGIFILAKPQASTENPENYTTILRTRILRSDIKIDETTHYDSINIPEQIPLENGETARRYSLGNLGKPQTRDFGDSSKLIAEMGRSQLYRLEEKNVDTGLTNISYYLKFPFGTIQDLFYEPNSLSMEGYVFNDGVSVRNAVQTSRFDMLAPVARGCGLMESAVTRSDKLTSSDLVAIGKTNAGRTVYEIKDKNSTLYKRIYQEYKDSYDDSAISFADYVKQHGTVVIENAQGEKLVYMRDQYAPSYGCGKPVIYLYPENPTLVDVKVGAKVEISEPFYPQATGWQKVWAEPSGQLTYQGKKYDSLFWEGIGYGKYPSIQSGVVVARAEALSTMRRHLKELGLNEKESADFVEYWQNYIPNKAFVRLTWFNTEELDILAPLKVVPKPDTVIRVFLDMAGSDEWFDLPAQDLSSIPRRGFTLVEWGGLVSGF